MQQGRLLRELLTCPCRSLLLRPAPLPACMCILTLVGVSQLVQESSNQVELSVNTSTVHAVDDHCSLDGQVHSQYLLQRFPDNF